MHRIGPLRYKLIIQLKALGMEAEGRNIYASHTSSTPEKESTAAWSATGLLHGRPGHFICYHSLKETVLSRMIVTEKLDGFYQIVEIEPLDKENV